MSYKIPGIIVAPTRQPCGSSCSSCEVWLFFPETSYVAWSYGGLICLLCATFVDRDIPQQISIMATAPDSTHIPAWKGSSLSKPYAVNIKTDHLQQSDSEKPEDAPRATPVQPPPQVVSSTSEEMAAHSTALNRLFRAAEDLEIAEKDERDALAKAAALTAVKQQCLRARDDAKRALAAAGRSCRLAAEAHHAELLRQLAASTASLAASLATTSDDGDLGATSLDAAASAASPSTKATSAPTSTPATISATTSTTYSAKRSPAAFLLSGASPCPPPPLPSSAPTGTHTDPVSIVEANPASPPPVAATLPPEVVTQIEATDVLFLDANIEDVRQADGLDRSATEDISFAATRVLRFFSARESAAITVAAVIDRAATNTSGGFACAVNNLVTALRRFHTNTEHSWFSPSSPAAASGVLAPSPSPCGTSFFSSSSRHYSRGPVIPAGISSTGIRNPQRVRPSGTRGHSRRTASSSSNVNSFSDNNTATSAAYMRNRRRVHDYHSRNGYTHPRRPADAAATTTSSSSGRPHDDDRPHLATATHDVSSGLRHMRDINSTTTTASKLPAPCDRRDCSAGKARLLRDDSRDLYRRGNTRHRLHRDDSRDRLCRDTYTTHRPRSDNNGDTPCGNSNGDGPRQDDVRERSRGNSNQQQPHQKGSRDRSRANDNKVQRRGDNNRGQRLNDDFRGRPRDDSLRGSPRQNDDGGRPRTDNNRGQPWRDNSRDQPRGDNDDDRPRTNSDDQPRSNNDNRSRVNNSGNPPRGDRRDRHQQLRGCANGPDDRHPSLKTDDDGNCVGNKGRRGHRWGVKGMVPASGLASGFASCFASGSESGFASTTPSTSKRSSSPSRPASTRPPQRPRFHVADYLSSNCDGSDVFVSPPTLFSNATAASVDGAVRSFVSSTTACAQRTATNDAEGAVLEASSMHAVEQAYVGIGMR